MQVCSTADEPVVVVAVVPPVVVVGGFFEDEPVQELDMGWGDVLGTVPEKKEEADVGTTVVVVVVACPLILLCQTSTCFVVNSTSI